MMTLAGWDLGMNEQTAIVVGHGAGLGYEISDVYSIPMMMSDATYRAQARRWWARDWSHLRNRDRRRLRRSPAQLARHVSWNQERERRIDVWFLGAMDRELHRMVTVGVIECSAPFGGTGDTIGADGPLSLEVGQ